MLAFEFLLIIMQSAVKQPAKMKTVVAKRLKIQPKGSSIAAIAVQLYVFQQFCSNLAIAVITENASRHLCVFKHKYAFRRKLIKLNCAFKGAITSQSMRFEK